MENLLKIGTEVIWYFLPAFGANIMPVIASRFKWMPALSQPLDGGLVWQNKRLLGDNKTIRGFIVGIVTGAVIGLLQYTIAVFPIIPVHSIWQAIGWGALVGTGALFGDALKSFFKRRLSIPPGKSWKPWDQIDIVIGVLLLTMWIAPLSWLHILVACILIGLGMILTSLIGVKTGIKKAI